MKKEKVWKGFSIAVGMALAITVLFTGILYAMEKPGGFPNRPITMVTCYGKGGGSDQVTRGMAAPLSKIVGVPVMVVNKAGGAGVVGIKEFLAAPNDGYTLLQHTDGLAGLKLQGLIKEDPTIDFVPLAMTQMTFSQIYVNTKDDRFPNWEAFVKYAKAHPGEMKMANVGATGGMDRLMSYQLMKEAGLKINEVAFGKSSQRYASLVGRHVDVLFEQPGDVVAYVKSGDMKPILTLMYEAPKGFEGTPTLADFGYKIKILWRYRGFWAPRGVPEDRMKYLEWAFHEGFKSKAYQKFNKSKYMDLVPSYRNRAESIALLRETLDIYKPLYKELGIEIKK